MPILQNHNHNSPRRELPSDLPPTAPPTKTRPAPWELALAALAAALALAFGFANLGVPSLWHDELVHVFVSKSLLEQGWPSLPSGQFYINGTVFHLVQALFIALFGDGEVAVRAPAVLFGACSVLLTFLVIRPLLGRATALVAALALAISPWSVAWSRQARFYTLQQSLYLVTLWAIWAATAHPDGRGRVRWALSACASYLASILTAFHSILFLAAPGVYATLMGLYDRRLKSRWTFLWLVVLALGALTIAWNFCIMTPQDIHTTFAHPGMGGKVTEYAKTRDLYFRFLAENLSRGYLMTALIGYAMMLLKEERRGLFVAVSFWAPVLVLTYLIGYRMPRFMFFAFPLYMAGFAYGLVQMGRFVVGFRRSWFHAAGTLLILAFGARLAVSTVKLVGNSVETARGANNTLAVVIPEWREPCLYVREHLDGFAVITTTYLPVLYYVGRVDNWYPSRFTWWEHVESNMEGLKTLDDLKGFVTHYPKGYFLAEIARFRPGDKRMIKDQAWVNAHMRLIPEASNPHVSVYTWSP